MTDIASLEIKVDSRTVAEAAKDLESLASAASKLKDVAGLTKFSASLKSAASDFDKSASGADKAAAEIEKFSRILAASIGETDKLRKTDVNSYITYMKKMESAYKENEKIHKAALEAQRKAEQQMSATTSQTEKLAIGYGLLNTSMQKTVVTANQTAQSLSSLLGMTQKQEAEVIKAAQGYDLLSKSMQSVARSSTDFGSVSVVTGRSLASIETASAGAEIGLKGLAKSMYQFLLVGAGISTFIGMFQRLKEAVQVTAEFEKMNKTLALTSSTAGEAGRDMQFIRKASADLGLSIVSTGEAFAKLKASALGTKMEGEGVKQIFLSVSKAMAAIGASEGETTGALRAIGQMMNKGKIMAEELRGQLGEHLPGALNIMARALGVSTQELDKMVTKGLDANEVLPKFAAELDKLGDKAKFDSIENNLNRIQTAIAGMTEAAVQAAGIPKIIAGIADAVTPVDTSIAGIQKRIQALISEGPQKFLGASAFDEFNGKLKALNKELEDATAKQDRLAKQSARQGAFTGGSVGAVAGGASFADTRTQEQINERRKQGEQQLKTLESERLQISIALLRAKGDELGAIRAEVDAMGLNKTQTEEVYKKRVELYQLEEKNREARKSTGRTDDSEAKAIEREKARQQRVFENMAQELMIQTAKYEGMSEADIHYYEGLKALEDQHLTAQQEASVKALLERKQWQEETVANLNDAIKAEEDLRKAAADAEKQSQKDVRDEALRTLEVMNSNLEYARELATGLADAFGDVGSAIGGMGVAMAEYAKQQETIRIQKDEDIRKHPEKQYQIEEAAALKSARAQVKSYGDMTQAAQGFFKKGTAGYKGMEAATKVFRALEIALSVKSMLQEIFATNQKTAAVVTGMNEQTTATVTGAAAQESANLTATGVSATKAVADASGGDPYTGLIRGAAMLAFMVAIGAMTSGASASSAGTTKTPEQAIQDKLDAAMKAETGTVFGSNEVSNSILDALDTLVSNSSIDLDYTKGMKRSLELLTFNVNSAALQIAGGVLPSAAALQTLGVTRKDNFSATGNKFGDMALGTAASAVPIVGAPLAIIDAIMGSTKITRTLTDYGVQFYDQSLKTIIKSSMVLASTYTDVEVKKNTSAMFGMMESESKKTETTYELLNNTVSKSIAKVIIGIANNITKAADLLHVGGAEFETNLMKFNVSLGKMSTFYTAGDLVKLVSAKLNKVSDQMAQKAFAGMGLGGFQKVGEGFFKTMARVASGVATAEGVLQKFGVTAVSFKTLSDAAKQGDAAVEIFRKSIVESTKIPVDVQKVVNDAYASSIGDIADFVSALLDAKDAMQKVGMGYVEVTQSMINAAGGISALNDSLKSFFDNFYTDQQRLEANTASLSRKFRTLGLLMPSLAPSVDALTGEVKPATESFKALVEQLSKYTNDAGKQLYVQVLGLSSAFADAAQASAKATDDMLKSAKKLADDASASAKAAATTYSSYMQEIYTMNGDSADAAKLKRTDEMKAIQDTIDALSADIAKRRILIQQLGVNATSTDTLSLSQSEANLAVATASLNLRDYLNELIAQDDAVKQAQKNLDTATSALEANWKIITESAAKNLKDRQALEKQVLDDSLLYAQKNADTISALDALTAKSANEAKQARESEIQAMDESLQSFARAVDKLSESKTALNAASEGMQTAFDALKSISDRFGGLMTGLVAYKAELNATDVSLTKDQKYLAAKTLFEQTAAAASTYNPSQSSKVFEQAVADLPAVSKAFLEASAQFGTAIPQYQSDLAAVKAAVDNAISTTQTQIDIMQKQLDAALIANNKLQGIDISTGGVQGAIESLKGTTAAFTKAQNDYNSALSTALSLLPTESKSEQAMKDNLLAVKAIQDANTKSIVDAINNMSLLLQGYNAANDALVAATKQQSATTKAESDAKIQQLIDALGAAKSLADQQAANAAADLKAKQEAADAATAAAELASKAAVLATASANLFKQIAGYGTVQAESQSNAAMAASKATTALTPAGYLSRMSSQIASTESNAIDALLKSASATGSQAGVTKAELDKTTALLPLQIAAAQQKSKVDTALYDYGVKVGLGTSSLGTIQTWLNSFGRNSVAGTGYTKVQVGQSYDAWSKAFDAYQQALANITTVASASYAVGTSSVPQDMVANVHRGEKIIDPTSSAILNRYGIQVKTDADGKSFQELKAQTNELQALVRLQSAANMEMIKELKGVKAEVSELSRKAKIEAAA